MGKEAKMPKKPDKKIKIKPKQEKIRDEKPAKAVKSANMENGNTDTGGIWTDSRFQHLLADPRFRGVPKVQRKVKIDKRFQSMFEDERFKVKYTVDKYGRPVNKTNLEDLRKFYDLDESSDEEDQAILKVTKQPKVAVKKDENYNEGSDKEDQSKPKKKNGKKQAKALTAENEKNDESSDEEEQAKLNKTAKAATAKEFDDEDEERRAEELAITRDDNDVLLHVDSDDEEVPENLRKRLTNPTIDYARGEGRLMTDSSSDEESSDNDESAGGPELQIDHVWGELDMEAESTEESTRRLAVCNMDWDRIRAQDLMVLLSSFLPPGGVVLSVKIYPSEYGKARMAEEDVHGPTELLSFKREQDPVDLDSDEELVREQDSDAEEGDDYHMEKLRQYQLNRLRYYYAVVECDTVTTADKVYKECDGIEYESSATRVDLRFIPDETSFDEDTPTDECYELPDASNYKPRQFTTTALQQAKVDLTWDETALDRRELGDKLSSGKVDQLNDKELRQIVAYSSEEEEDENVDEVNELEKQQDQNKEVNKTEEKPAKRLKQKERIEKYKSLLADINAQEQQSKEKHYEMEMSWNVDTTEKQDSAAKEPVNGKTPQLLTPIEQVLQKRSEKNKLRKEKRRLRKEELHGKDPSDDESIPDGIDMNDAYFAEEFASGNYEKPKVNKKSKWKKDKAIKADDETTARTAAELELIMASGEKSQRGSEDTEHYSLSKILKNERKKRLEQDDGFRMNAADSRFKSVFKYKNFNIDPSNSNFKPTQGMQQLIAEKLKLRQQEDQEQEQDKQLDDEEPSRKRSKQKMEQNALVKSLKRKLKEHQS